MDKKTQKILTLILVVFLLFTISYMLFDKNNNRIALFILFSLLSVSIFFRHKFLYESKKYEQKGNMLILIESALIYWIMLLDKSGASQILFYVHIGQAIIIYSIEYSLVFAGVNVISFVIITYIKLGHPAFSSFISGNVVNIVVNFTFVYGFIFVAKYQIIQKQKLHNIARELELKTKELEYAYHRLQDSFDAKEEVTILSERNRIAGEIHDTVGHTLTTVLIEIEAGKRLMKKDLQLAQEKLDLAQEQVRKGLNDIRKSVRTLKEGNTLLEFIPSIESLIHETEKHSGVEIDYSISDIPNINKDIEKALYRALQEGLTNGIRHGKSNKFNFSLKYVANNIEFTLSDKGCGCENIELGFGLSNMKYRVEQLGGNIKIDSVLQKGCTVMIIIPINGEEI